MRKVLMITSVASMIKQFNIQNLKILQELGYHITVATNFESPGTITIDDALKLKNKLEENGINAHNIHFQRSPLSKKNWIAYKQIKQLINQDYYDLIHCQSPIGGVLARLVARKVRREGTKIIYTAHGFHFFNGSPKKNWVFYLIEKYMSKHTDVLLTINKQDYQRALDFGTCFVEYIPGIGVNTSKFNKTIVKKNKREELGIPNNVFLILSVGELNQNKNHRVIIEALNKLKNPKIHYTISGIGPEKDNLIRLVERYNLKNQVHFLGYRNDIHEIYKIADIFAFPSKREGLGIAAIEAMASGLLLLTSDRHGINDYCINNQTGLKYNPEDINGFAKGILRFYSMNKSERTKLGNKNIKMSEKFDQKVVNEKMKRIYKTL